MLSVVKMRIAWYTLKNILCKSKYKSCWSMVIAFEKYITSRGLRPLCNGPGTPTHTETVCKSESVTYGPTNSLGQVLEMLTHLKLQMCIYKYSYMRHGSKVLNATKSEKRNTHFENTFISQNTFISRSSESMKLDFFV